MSQVTLTAAMRANLLSLQQTADLLSSTQLRIATGKKVNSALDNPSAFFAAQGLNNRANDLSALLDGMGQAVQTMKAADQGIQGLLKLVQQAKSVAESARALAENGTPATPGVAGSLASFALDISSDGQDTVIDDALGVSRLQDGDNTLEDAQFTIKVGDHDAQTITMTSSMTVQELIDAINTAGDGNGFRASIDISGGLDAATIKIDATEDAKLTIADVPFKGDLTNYVVDQLFSADGDGTDHTLENGTDPVAANLDNSAERTNLSNQYSTIMEQIDAFVKDAGYRGINLLNGDTLTVKFNEDGTSKIDVVGTKRDSAGLGLTTNSVDFSDSNAVDTELGKITDALASLRSDSTAYGNNLAVIQARQDFTQNLINVLTEGADKLVLADKNEEAANMLSLQTTQQLGIQALSLASQANQSVLRLFA